MSKFVGCQVCGFPIYSNQACPVCNDMDEDVQLWCDMCGKPMEVANIADPTNLYRFCSFECRAEFADYEAMNET